MSRVMTLDGQQVEFMLNDADNLTTEDLSDIIYSDGTRAILVNTTGQILQTGNDMQTVVLQDDDFNQYYINDENGEILVADEQDIAVTQSLGDAEVVQFIEDDSNALEEPQIIYVNEEGYAINDSDLSQYEITEGENNDIILPSKTIKLETQVVDLEELIRQQGGTTVIDTSNDANGYQYAILKDGKLHIQTYSGEIFPISSTDIVQEPETGSQVIESQEFDLSRITGRNLLTGQTVTLHSYMDKLQKKMKDSTISKREAKDAETLRKRRTTSSTGLKGLLNKKLMLGKTSSGKRLVGKVIHVEKKNGNNSAGMIKEHVGDIEENSVSAADGKYNCDGNLESGGLGENKNRLKVKDKPSTDPDPKAESAEELPRTPPAATNKKKVLIHEKLVSKECFEQISRTLGGLMSMESVKKKLQYKSIIVKVVERKYEELVKGYARKVSYSSGHMQEEFVVDDEGDMSENWSFVSDTNIKASMFGVEAEGDGNDQEQGNQYPETTNVTVIITQDKTSHRSIRVVLNPTNLVRCTVCDKEFRSAVQLKVHMINAHTHKSGARLSRTCEVCGLQFDDLSSLNSHREEHAEEGKLFRCPVEECGKFFQTARRLQRHGAVHDKAPRVLECSVCHHRCSNASALKKHLLTHMNIRHFSCDVCGKRFTNPGDLNFHKRVHDPYKYYACEVCKRTFSRHSNLQRHVAIHQGSEELYHCSICGCSYHYMSSLTRHVVQNHIQQSEAETPPMPTEDDNEET